MLLLLAVVGNCQVPGPSVSEETLRATGTNMISLVSFRNADFLMGSPNHLPAPWFPDPAAYPEHRVRLSPFAICEFLNSNGLRSDYTKEGLLLRDLNVSGQRFSPRPGKASFPVRGVSFRGAEAYCRWLSEVTKRRCRLPTEAEWEFVAKGKQGRTYPWGEETVSDNPLWAPVGVHPKLATPEGVNDLNGPVYQWCVDRYSPDFYKRSGMTNPACTTGDSFVLRGGPLFRYNGKLTMPATWKRFQQSEDASFITGFRIVVEEQDAGR
jgi:formylglycine-generating enzyme required for sulfatase activity